MSTPTHREVAIVIFAVAVIVVIVIAYIYVTPPFEPGKRSHQLFVKLVNSTPTDQEVNIEGKTTTLGAGQETGLTVRSDAVIKSPTVNSTLSLRDNVDTVYLLPYGFSTNLSSVVKPFYNNTGIPAMFIDASGLLSKPRMAKEIVAPHSPSTQSYVISEGSRWQVVNPIRNDVILAEMDVRLKKSERSSRPGDEGLVFSKEDDGCRESAMMDQGTVCKYSLKLIL